MVPRPRDEQQTPLPLQILRACKRVIISRRDSPVEMTFGDRAAEYRRLCERADVILIPASDIRPEAQAEMIRRVTPA